MSSKHNVYPTIHCISLEQTGGTVVNWSHTRSSSQASHYRSNSTPGWRGSQAISGSILHSTVRIRPLLLMQKGHVNFVQFVDIQLENMIRLLLKINKHGFN